MHILCSYKQDLKIRIIEDLEPYGTVVPMQMRNNAAKVIMPKFTNGAVRLQQADIEMIFNEYVQAWFV
jgi:hypothetical protein